MLTAFDEYTRFGNLIFLWSWTPRMTPRSSATHAPGSGLISTDALSKKNSKFYQKSMVVKGLKRMLKKILYESELNIRKIHYIGG